MYEKKNSLQGQTGRFNLAEEKIGQFKFSSIEIIQSEEQEKKKNE